MKILVTGANGFLGSRICSYYREKHGIYGLTHQDVDFTDVAQLQKIFTRINPEIVIHCGAVSSTEECRKNPDSSWYSNVYGTGTVADVCTQIDAKLIFCSSDQVYGKGNPELLHKENEELIPDSIYGNQKLSAEKLAKGRNLDTVSLRLSWMYDINHRKEEHGDLISSIISCIERRERFQFSPNDYRYITNVWDVVEVMEKICYLPEGTYNIGSFNELSTYELVKQFLAPYPKVQELLEIDEQNQLPVRNLRMNTELSELYGIKLPKTMERLERARELFEKQCATRGIELK